MIFVVVIKKFFRKSIVFQFSSFHFLKFFNIDFILIYFNSILKKNQLTAN